MFKLTVLTSFIALLCTGLGYADARVLAREAGSDDVIKRSALVQRDVVTPPITYPTTGTVWNVGERHNCTWDTSVIPPGFNSTGMIVLGYLDDADGDNEHLDLNNPLAQGFPITSGRAEITVPSVTNRNTYILVLFGDSGNASGKFTIKNISIGQPSSSSVIGTPTPTPSSAASSSTENTSVGSFNISNITATSTSLGSFSLGTATATGPVSGTAEATSTALSSGAPGSTSGSSTAPPSAAADGASPATTSNSTSAGARSASFSGPAAWISTACSLAVVLGWAAL